MDAKYMQTLRFLMHLMGAWPYKAFGQDVKPLPFRSTKLLAVEWFLVLIGGLTYCKTHFHKVPFIILSQTYLTVFFNIIGVQRVTMPLVHRKSFPAVIVTFVDELHLIRHRHKSEYSEQISRRVGRLCTIAIKLLHTEMLAGILMFNIALFLNNYRLGMFRTEKPEGMSFEHSINYSLPFNYHTNTWGYLLIASINVVLSYDCGLAFAGFDLLLSCIVFHMWGHLKILDHNCRTFPKPLKMREMKNLEPASELSYTDEENIMVGKMLKEMVNHHRMIMSVQSLTSTAFGPMLCLYYTFHQVAGCIMLLECSRMDVASVGRYVAVVLCIFHLLIQISVIVELLGSQSETLKDAVYELPWEYMNTSNRKIVLFLLYNVQTPIRLKPMGMVSVGVQTMATILKTSISYFMLLRTVTTE